MARTTTRSGRREMNPTDAYRKLQRKKEVQKNKKERKKVREFSAMVRNPDLMVEEVRDWGMGMGGREGGREDCYVFHPRMQGRLFSPAVALRHKVAREIAIDAGLFAMCCKS